MKNKLPGLFSGVLSVLMFLLHLNLNAVPAYPGLIEFKQPDGTIIHIFLKGDEKINRAETTDGFTILVTKDGEYQYATKDSNDDLVFSGIVVSPTNKHTAFPENTNHTISATASDEFEFVNWTENGLEISNNPIYSFIIEHDREIQANFQLLSPTSVNITNMDMPKVYPNPASEWLYIETDNSHVFTSVILYNTMGQKLIHYDTSLDYGKMIIINVSELTAGIYLLQLLGENKQHYQKVILE